MAPILTRKGRIGYNGRMQLLEHATWVVVDLETTGVSHAKGDRIVEIGAVRLDGDRITGEFQTLVNPGRSIPYFAQRVHGISDRMVSSAPGFSEVFPEFLSFCGENPLISHNAPFDRGFLDAEALRAFDRKLSQAHLDTLRLSRQLLPKLPKHNLDALVSHFGIRLEGDRHRALADARATAHLWIHLRRMAQDMGLETGRTVPLRGLLKN